MTGGRRPRSPRATLSRRAILRRAGTSVVACSGLARAGRAWAAEPTPPVRAVTRGPRHHFFGYYDKCPWDASGRYLLAMEVAFCDRQPEPGETLTIGMVDLRERDRFIPLDKTAAWCWQQGTMLQWLGTAEREVVYNSVRDGQYVSIVRDVFSGKTRTLPRPVYAVTRDGGRAVTLDFDRLHRLRPGYGYGALPERHGDQPAPRDAGIYAMDLRSGDNRCIVTLDWAAGNRKDARFAEAEHWFNHLEFNPAGTRFTFLHRWRRPETKGWSTRLYTAAPDGSDIRLLADAGMVSHFAWRDDSTLLAWARSKDKGDRFYLIDDRTGDREVLGEGVLTHDGHCSYSPDGRWVLTDGYPDKEGKQPLLLYRVADGKRLEIGRFFQPAELRGQPYRCDLHPRWSRDGHRVCIDSSHELPRQVYVIDVGGIVGA